MCAAAQGKFWPYTEALFRDQQSIGTRADAKPYLDSLAKANGVDMIEFARCRKSNAVKSLVESDLQQANRAGVRSTPSFLVGEFLVEGAVPYADFRKAIDTALITARTKRSR
jgi:protein-disulfide isomerase